MRILHSYNKELNNKFISHNLINSSFTQVISHLIYKITSFIKGINPNINMVQVLSTNNSKDFNLWFINNKFNPFNKSLNITIKISHKLKVVNMLNTNQKSKYSQNTVMHLLKTKPIFNLNKFFSSKPIVMFKIILRTINHTCNHNHINLYINLMRLIYINHNNKYNTTFNNLFSMYNLTQNSL